MEMKDIQWGDSKDWETGRRSKDYKGNYFLAGFLVGMLFAFFV